jgi:hypothetical protein
LLFVGAQGATSRPGNLRYRVVIPAAERAGVPWARCHTLRHTCPLCSSTRAPARCGCSDGWAITLPAFTLDNYGHLFDDSLGPHLSLGAN